MENKRIIPEEAFSSFMANRVFYYNLFLGLNVKISARKGHIVLHEDNNTQKEIGCLSYLGYMQPYHTFKAFINGKYVYLSVSQDSAKMSLVSLNGINPQLDYDLLKMEANIQNGKPRSILTNMKHYINGKEDINYGFINTANNVAFRVKRDHDCESIINATDGTQVIRNGESGPLLSIFALKYNNSDPNNILTKKRYLTIRQCTKRAGSYYIKMGKMGKNHELKHTVYDINSSNQTNLIINGLWDADKVSAVTNEVIEGLRGMMNPDFIFYNPDLYFGKFNAQNYSSNKNLKLNEVSDSLSERIYYEFNIYPVKYCPYDESYIRKMLAGPKH